jgi:hypothetical protein
VFWITTGTSSLDVITTVNGLPDRIGQTPFDSGSQALNWVASSSNYFAVGPDYYRDMDADQLRLFYHANQVISYPTTQSTWYDLSGYTNPNGTLTNGPVWNSNGWIEFDGTNDVVYTTPWALNNEFSYEGTFYIDPSDSSYSGFFGNMYSPSGYSFSGNGWIVRLEPGGALEVYLRNNVAGGTRTILINSFRSTYSGKWFNLAFVSSGSTNTLYVNNTAYNGSAYTVGSIDPSAELLIGAYDWGGRVETYYLKGANEYTRAYSKALSATEVAQNYYGGPIVTSDLQLAVDAGNLVSYPKSGTSLYDLTGNSRTGTLTNGPTFTTKNGGGIVLDGTNDWITFGNQGFISSNFTMDIWFELNDNVKEHYIFTTGYNTPGSFLFYSNGTSLAVGFWDGGAFISYSGGVIPLNTPVNITVTREGDQVKVYQNGGLTNTHSEPLPLNPGTYSIGWATPRNKSTAYMLGKVYSLRLYDRHLTAEEVQQNYNATN